MPRTRGLREPDRARAGTGARGELSEQAWVTASPAHLCSEPQSPPPPRSPRVLFYVSARTIRSFDLVDEIFHYLACLFLELFILISSVG